MVILLVEDSPSDVEITKRAFEKGKLRNKLCVVGDGQEALDFLYHQREYQDESKSPRPDLILLDINLPKLNGIEVLKRLKADPDLKRIPVIILTVSDKDEYINKSFELGATSYIVKPVEFDKFVQSMKGYYYIKFSD